MTAEPRSAVPAELRLNRLYCSRAVFNQELPQEHGVPASLGRGVDVKIGIGVRGAEEPEGPLLVKLSVFLAPSESDGQPYRVEVTYVGEFEVAQPLEPRQREILARSNCAAILLPYVRQAVTDLTARGMSGPVFLPPVNIVAMLAPPRDGDEAEA